MDQIKWGTEMKIRKCESNASARRLLSELACSTSGNTLGIFAAFLMPLLIMTGAGVDTARVYVVKARLQQACDAGALAGRKTMTATTGTSLDTTAQTQANSFFNNNFKAGWIGTTGVAFTPARANDGQVNATATATVPMTLMKMFGNNSVPLTVTCSARMDIGDSDIMFVLDLTGSMGCTPANVNSCGGRTSYTRPDGTTGYHRTEETGSKIQGLRDAVLLFYDTIDANKPAAANVRYGFVPYSNAVNVGYQIPSTYLVDSHTYESRRLDPGPTTVTGGIPSDVTNGSSTSANHTTATNAACDALAIRTPATLYNIDGRATVKTKVSWVSGANGCVIRSQPVKVSWRYESVSLDVSTYKTGTAVTDPSKVTGATSKWQGCIEERDTTTASSFNINSLPGDLDPDLMPTNDATKWRPFWPNVVYYRGNNTSIDNSGGSTTVYGDTTTTSFASTSNASDGQYTNLLSTPNAQEWEYAACMKAAQRLAVMTRTEVSNYVNHSDFKAHGWTYHDHGMIWGTRFISPTGPFASDTAAWGGNSPPNRYIVFMSDGALNTNPSVYGLYGMERYSAKITGSTGHTNANQNTRHNARFLAVCNAAKARNITVFVVAFGTAMTTEMNTCATPGFAYTAGDNAALATAFGQIALKVAKLRLTQ